jgi:uracil-DNA glycosylase
MKQSKKLDYQQRCFSGYSESIGLPEKYTYPDGNPIRPLPPIRTQTQGLMIIGAYPSARFESRPSPTRPGIHRLIPVADNLQPFGREEYFDGTRIRSLTSADTLKKFILDPLGLTLGDCWVTDLVKVFLYKPGHADSLSEVKPEFTVPVLRNKFYDLGRKSLSWLREEIDLCQPQLVVTLGQEVAQVVHEKKSAPADDLLKDEIIHPEALNVYPTMHLPHPDACRRMEKWREHLKGQIKTIKGHL